MNVRSIAAYLTAAARGVGKMIDYRNRNEWAEDVILNALALRAADAKRGK